MATFQLVLLGTTEVAPYSSLLSHAQFGVGTTARRILRYEFLYLEGGSARRGLLIAFSRERTDNL